MAHTTAVLRPAARGRGLLLLALLLTLSCGEAHNGPSLLSASRWKLESLRTPAGVATAVNPERYTLEFGQDLRVSARADCNVCGGPYKVASIEITIGPLNCTRVACEAGSRGNDYVTLLNSAKLYDLEGEALILVSDSGTLLYRP